MRCFCVRGRFVEPIDAFDVLRCTLASFHLTNYPQHRWYQLPGDSGQSGGTEGSNTPYPGRAAAAAAAGGEGETATFEVTTEAGGGGGYEWLDGGQAGWVALPMRWHREGFPVGVLFVRLAGGCGGQLRGGWGGLSLDRFRVDH